VGAAYEYFSDEGREMLDFIFDTEKRQSKRAASESKERSSRSSKPIAETIGKRTVSDLPLRWFQGGESKGDTVKRREKDVTSRILSNLVLPMGNNPEKN